MWPPNQTEKAGKKEIGGSPYWDLKYTCSEGITCLLVILIRDSFEKPSSIMTVISCLPRMPGMCTLGVGVNQRRVMLFHCTTLEGAHTLHLCNGRKFYSFFSLIGFTKVTCQTHSFTLA